MIMAEGARQVTATYFSAWKKKDFATLRSLLADDVSFVGSLGTVDNADDYLEGIQRLSQIVTDIVIHKTFIDGADVLTWFDLHTHSAGPMPTANWSHVENGKITRVRVTFDPLTDQPSP